MNENIKSNLTSLEAPASWNTRYITPDGFVCQITLRADSGKELLDKVGAAMAHLTESGCKPYDNILIRPKSNINGHKQQNNNSSSSNNQGPTQADVSDNEAHTCPIHNVAMKRWEKNGRIWYSHKTNDGWCTGK